jgi:hypothetical protein
MGEARAETTIDKPADEVWAIVGNFGDLGWMGIESCRLEGEDRILDVRGGVEIIERQYERDDARQTLTYGIVASPMPIERHRATITVAPTGAGSRVTMDVDTDDGMVDMMRSTYQHALDALKAKLEG